MDVGVIPRRSHSEKLPATTKYRNSYCGSPDTIQVSPRATITLPGTAKTAHVDGRPHSWYFGETLQNSPSLGIPFGIPHRSSSVISEIRPPEHEEIRISGPQRVRLSLKSPEQRLEIEAVLCDNTQKNICDNVSSHDGYCNDTNSENQAIETARSTLMVNLPSLQINQPPRGTDVPLTSEISVEDKCACTRDHSPSNSDGSLSSRENTSDEADKRDPVDPTNHEAAIDSRHNDDNTNRAVSVLNEPVEKSLLFLRLAQSESSANSTSQDVVSEPNFAKIEDDDPTKMEFSTKTIPSTAEIRKEMSRIQEELERVKTFKERQSPPMTPDNHSISSSNHHPTTQHKRRVLNSESPYERLLRTTLDPRHPERRSHLKQDSSDSTSSHKPSQPKYSSLLRQKPIQQTAQYNSLRSRYSTGNINSKRTLSDALWQPRDLCDILSTVPIPRQPPPIPASGPPCRVTTVTTSTSQDSGSMRSRAARRKRMALSLDLSLVLDVLVKDSHSTALDSEDDLVTRTNPGLLLPSPLTDDVSPSGASSSVSSQSGYSSGGVGGALSSRRTDPPPLLGPPPPRPGAMDGRDYDDPGNTNGVSLVKAEFKVSDPGKYKMDRTAGHDYDRIKAECDRMNSELQSLEKKYDHAMKASTMYRHQYKVTKEQLDTVTADLEVVTADSRALAEDKARAARELERLERLRAEDSAELVELRRQAVSGSLDGFSAVYDKLVSQHEALKGEYDNLRQQYADTTSALSSSSAQTDRLQDEVDRIRKHGDALQQEKNTATKDRKILQQHVTSAIQAANREKNDLLRELQDMKKERDGFRKKNAHYEAQAAQTAKDMGRLKKERDAVVQEYSLVMSERDSVHKEMEQLQDKLTAAQTAADAMDKDKKKVIDNMDGMQREAGTLMEQRDRAIKLTELKDKYGEPRGLDFERLLPERGSGRRGDAHERRDTLELLERRDKDAKELDTLRKEMERLTTELKDTSQEKEDCKRRCDWAFSERDKIVRERESIRALCDKLRHERDNAVSKHIEALRDTDELKKQKSEATRELKDVKEKYETLVEKEARKGQLHSIAHNHSHDSAIDADLQEWETETLQLQIGDVTSHDLGIDLVGGRNDPQFPECSVFVANVRQDSCAHGKLKTNDQILKVNNLEVTNQEKSVVYQALYNSASAVHMVVRRRRMVTTRSILPVHINLGDQDLGVQLEAGLYVCRIVPGSASAREGNLAVGDRVVAVNGQSVDSLSASEVMRRADACRDHVTLNIIKYSVLTPQSSVQLSSTPSSGHNLTESSPDALSLSPRSPQMMHHHRSWVSQSPDSAVVAGKGSLSLKCSGSQTDSLDSPPASVCWPEQDKYKDYSSCDYHKDYNSAKSVQKDSSYSVTDSLRLRSQHDQDSQHRSSRSQDQKRSSYEVTDQRVSRDLDQRRSQDGQDSRRSYDILDQRRSHDQRSRDEHDPRSYDGSDNAKRRSNHDSRKPHSDSSDKKPHFSKSSDRTARDIRCHSGHPFFNMARHDNTTEEEVIEELNAMINQYDNQSPAPPPPPPKPKEKRRRDKSSKRDTSGTWPKCRAHVDHTHPPWVPPAFSGKQRSPLPNVSEDKHFSQQGDGKLPPTPPERTDSFSRSASVKHSPQNSDTYSHHSGSTSTKTPTSNGGLPAYSSPSSTTKSPDVMSKSDTSSLWSSGNHYTSPEQSHEPIDYSVRSAHTSQMYVRHRPISGGHSRHSRIKARAEERNARSSRDESSAQKPTSLNVQPMYSPRPLPHTAQTIKPTVASTTYNHGNQALSALSSHSSMSTPTGSGTLTPRDLKPTAASTPSSGGYPSSVPAQTQVLRSPQGLFQVATSTLVSPSGSGGPPSTGPSGPGLSSTPSPLSSQLGLGGPRYSSPPGSVVPPGGGGYMRGSGSSMLNSSIPEVEGESHGVYHVRDRFSATPSPSPSQQSSNFDHSMTTSDDFPYDVLHQRPATGGRHSYHPSTTEGTATYPHRHPQPERRIRIPSNHSVMSHKSAINSFERVSDCSSPVSPAYFPEYSHLTPGTSNSLPKAINDGHRRSRPRQGETREIKVEKSMEPLGIQIASGDRGGIFVSSVSDHSLASRAGITVGDQLLEVCGINMRKATKDLAASVLRQCGGSINMLVQYKPTKYHADPVLAGGSSSPSSESSASNTPEVSHNRKTVAAHRVSDETLTSDTVSPQTLSPGSLSPIHSSKPAPPPSSDLYPPVEPRFVMLKKSRPHDSLGVTLVGGNAVGIFIRSVQPSSVSGGPKGLRYGDQILEYNGMNFRSVTQEQAVVEISKPAEVVSILAQYNIQRLNKILDAPGDAVYIRALYERTADNAGELSFCRDDILYVDNTLYNGLMGVWRAWRVDDRGNKLDSGTVPSKARLEEELSLKRSQSDQGEEELSKSAGRRGSASARRSFFRKKKHQRSNSRDSRELNSFSDASINSDSANFLDDGSSQTFERVERLDSAVCRPVLILAPLAEPLINKLTSESPDKYCRCEPDVIKATISGLQTGQNEGLFVDFKARQDGQFECVTVQSVKEIISKNRHCMLSAHPDAIEHLHKVNIYPIVLFVKHKTSKEIREVKDTRFLPEKLSNKTVKELHDNFQGYEKKYKRLFSEVIPGGNLAYMCRMLKSSIDTEQKKTLWVPSGYL